MPKISVIVPVYNAEKHLNECLDSILSQTFTDFELILINDGSTDNSGSICDEYAKRDVRVIVLHHNNSGAATARNIGIDKAMESDSTWITFIDSDDLIHENMFMYLLSSAIDNDKSISICKFTTKIEELRTIKPSQFTCQCVDIEEFYVHNRTNSVVPWAKLFLKSLFYDIRFPRNKYAEDEFTIYKVLFKHRIIALINLPLYYYFNNDEGLSKGEWSLKNLDSLQAFHEQIAFFNELRYMQALKRTVYALIIAIDKNTKQIKLSNNKILLKNKLLNSLKKMRKETIKSYKCLFKFNTDRYFYELAYPHKMSIYWFIKGIGHKIKTIIGAKDAKD